ncbi:DRIM domain-containing protein [Phanerochaete sordida]|uniref:DRIM domain-containing protein n=1 Tax=Phanerochaete sordida TaxID=48140 RepID=A0A9P3GN90_9APHY|nr:DRIM domain-containing protein [Phanerochaete sordida]
MDVDDVPRPVRRFKHQSHKQALKQVHITPAISREQFEHDIDEHDSHFHQSLGEWRELNLTPAFLEFANKSEGLAASMALLVHHWKEVVELWLAAMDKADEEALKALLDLLQKLAHDLRTTIAPLYRPVLDRLLKLLPRTLAAEVLKILLDTFSVLFKYVGIPADAVEETWAAFAEVLPKCDPEVQRVVAELWGTTIRRLKAAAREQCALSIVTSASADVSSWVFVSACKSVSQTLHTTTPSLAAPLLRHYLTCEDLEVPFTVLRRLLTALAHHCKTAEQFSPLSDLLTEQLTSAPKEDTEQLRRLLEIVTVPCSVRQGSRMSAKHLATLLSHFETLPLSDALHAALLKFAAACLTAGDMALWMGPGRKVLARVWARPALALELCAVLADLNWGGWKLLALPQVVKHVPDLLDTHAEKALELLSALQQAKRLHVEAPWKQRLQAWFAERLAGWSGSSEQALILYHAIALSDLLPALSPILVSIITATLAAESPRDEYEQRETNSAWVLGSCLACLARRNPTEWRAHADIAAWTTSLVAQWHWSGYALEGLVSLINAAQASAHVPFAALYGSLRGALLSHSRVLRLAALRLLAARGGAPAPAAEVLRRCLQAEEVSVDVQGVRERVMRIGRMNHVLQDGDALGAEIAVRWLIAQLKVNLRPLWNPAAEALATIAERFGDLTWNLLFEQLKTASLNHLSDSAPGWMDVDDSDQDSISEQERSWRDPSAHKLRSSVGKRLQGYAAKIAIVKAQVVHDRFDPNGYELQLLNAFGACSSLAEKHNKDLIPYFLSLAPPDAPTKLARHKLTAWLTLFSKFSNPKALRSTDELRAMYTVLLSHPDRQLQKLAVACILTYKAPALVAHQDALHALLDDTRWRDALTQLDIAGIRDAERPEVVDTLVRLLFGVVLERRGRGRGGDRRAAILAALAGCRDAELHTLVALMLAPINRGREVCDGAEYAARPLAEGVADKQLVGFMTLLGDVVKNLGTRLVDRWPVLLATLLDVVAYAQGRLAAAPAEDGQENDEEQVADEEQEDEKEGQGSARAIRTVRQAGIKRFADFFRLPVAIDFTTYVKEAYKTFISPRLEALDVENTQAPSALLELFHLWSTKRDTARFLVDYDERTLPKIYACLVATNVKPTVVSRVLDIVEHLLGHSEADPDFLQAVFKPHVELLLDNFALLMERTKATVSMTDHIGRRQITILSSLAPFMADSKQASLLLNLFTPVLRKPTKAVPEKIKVDMVNILKNLLPLVADLKDTATATYTKTYALLSFLFQNLRSRPARVALVSTFRKFAEIDTSLTALAELMDELNAWSTKRMEEPDFGRRTEAFVELNERRHSDLSAREWLPILYNMLNFIQDPEELTVRSNASHAMKRFLDRVEEVGGDYEWTFSKTLYPGLKNGLRSKNELVRAEILGVISYAVKKCDRLTSLQEMRVLLANGDEEANIFNNILHVQLHRRTRALRRLAEFCNEGALRSTTLADIFVPLIGNFIVDPSSVDHTLATEAIITTGKMARQLQWGAYYALIQQYLRLSRNKDASERVYVRALVAILDNFHFSMDIVVPSDEGEEAAAADEEEAGEAPEKQPENLKKLAHITEVVNSRLLPSLITHLEKRDETEDSLRIPIAIGIVQVAMHLPLATRETQVSRLVTTLSQVFRSKSQETRDLARETMCKIAVILGPSYLPLILRELRTALLRGPHLHVLAFVTHALLVHVTSGDHAARFTTLDDCVNDVAHVSAEVIFGESGKDVQSEDFKTKMREVRGSAAKGLDSFALIAKFITPPRISSLLVPVRNILQQTETLKVMQQVEDLLRRVAGGLNANEHLTPKDLLVLCHTLISQNAKFLKHIPKATRGNNTKLDVVTEMKKHLTVQADHYANNSFRFVIFGLDLFNTAYRRSRFDFQDPAIIARLEPMVSVIGNTLYSNHMQVVVSGLKAAASIVRCPLKSIAKSLPVFIRQILEVVRQTGSTEAEVVQTAFKSLATILREQPAAQIKEKNLVFLLELLSPDLEEPARQAAVFTMLKAIVARKFVVPEIYDLMDRVSEIMVTSQSPSVQEQCRAILLQFLLDYPQGKGRLRNHMTFLAKNLSYVHESGRKSVMELLSAVLAKFDPALIREYSDLLFVALVLVIANDESTKCREMASELVKTLFSRLEEAQRRVVMAHVHSWASQRAQPQLARVSSQIYGILIDHLQGDVAPYASAILEDLNAILDATCKLLADGEDEDDAMEVDIEWQIPYQALNALAKLLRVLPELVSALDKVRWRDVAALLLFPHAWVRTAACRLLGVLFAAVPAAVPRTDVDDSELFSLGGMEEVARKLCLQLRSEHLDAALSLQVVKNLFYVGKCFVLYEATLPVQDAEEDKEEDEEEAEDEAGEGEEEQHEEEESTKHPLSWLFSKLSFQARSAHIARRNKSSSPDNWYHQPMSVFRWFAAMVSFMEPTLVERFLTHILSPLYRIAEDDTIRDPHMDELKTTAVELQELVQTKVGITKFAETYGRIRQNVLGVRRERRTARVVQAAKNPAMASKRKAQRNVAKKDSRKRKNNTFAEGRGKFKRRRDE